MIIQELKLRNYPYRSRRGLSESLARSFFIRQGYEVFRGVMLLGREWSLNYGKYENVRNKYDRLEAILIAKLGLRLWLLRQEMLGLGGIPDFFVHRSKEDCFFAEIKLEHESVKEHQLECMALLEQFGFKTLLFRIKSKPYRIKSRVRLAGSLRDNLRLSNREILVKQERIKRKRI